jgi:cystathionine beta-lyase
VQCIDNDLPSLKVTNPDATYLAWIDCREANIGDPFEFFMQKAKIAFNDGFTFGEDGQGFVRMNFGCPRPILLDALGRMIEALQSK